MNEGMILAIDYLEFLAKVSKDILSILTKMISDQFYCTRYHTVQGARYFTVKVKFVKSTVTSLIITVIGEVY